MTPQNDTYATVNSNVTGSVMNPPPFSSTAITGTAKGTVSSKLTGPGSGNPGDPNPVNSPSITLSVSHVNDVNIKNFGPGTNSIGVSQTTSAGTNSEYFKYQVNTNAPAVSTVTINFDVIWKGSTVVGIYSTPHLELKSTWFTVDIDTNGFVAKDAAGNVIRSDPTFATSSESADGFNLSIPNVPNGANLDFKYNSDLVTSSDSAHPWAQGATVAVNSTFDWTLKFQVS